MLIKKVDDICLQALQRRFGHLLDVLWTAVQTSLLAILDAESKLRRDHYMLAKWRERLPDKFFIPERAVHFSGIEKRNAAFDGSADQRNSGFVVHRPAVA